MRKGNEANLDIFGIPILHKDYLYKRLDWTQPKCVAKSKKAWKSPLHP